MALKAKGYENLCCDLTYRRFANNYKAEHYDVKNNTSFHEDLYKFGRNLLDSIQNDMAKGEKIEPARMYAVTKIMTMLKNVKIYEDKVTSENHMPKTTKSEGLSPEVIREIEEKILGITYDD